MVGSDLDHLARADAPQSLDIQPRLKPRPWVVLLIAAAVVALMIATFIAGLAVRGSDETAYENSLRNVYATAKVEKRTEAPVLSQGTAVGGASVQILATVPDGSIVAQVSVDPLPVGSVVQQGAVVTAVSGRPVFALPISGPFFRDLVLYDVGSDVTGLNRALASLGYDVDAGSDEYGWDTAAAVDELYSNSGFVALRPPPTVDPSNPSAPAAQLPRGGSLPFAEVAVLASPNMIVTSAEPRLAVVEEGAVVAKLSSSVTSAITRVNALDVQQLTEGQSATVQLPGAAESLKGSISSISDFLEGAQDGSSIPGYDVVVSIQDGAVALIDGQVVSIEFEGAPDEFLAIPATALQQDGSKTFVWRASKDSFEAVQIAVRRVSDGWALLASPTDLVLGDTVRIG